MEKCKLILQDKSVIEVPKGIKLSEIEKLYYSDHPSKIMAFMVNYEMQNLNYRIVNPENNLIPIDLNLKDGIRIYQRCLIFVLSRAVREVFSDATTEVAHSLSKGLFCEVQKKTPLTAEDVAKIKVRMQEIIALDEEFKMSVVPTEEARKIYISQGMQDKADLLDYRKEKEVKVYKFGWMSNYFYGYMLPSSGKLDKFDLKFYDNGIILIHPRVYSNGELPEFVEQKKIAEVHREAENWGEILDVGYIHNINKLIETGGIKSQILTTEALHEKKIIKIADQIFEKKSRIILIAGPSSSGKTTFANRLRVQLRVHGLKPVTISIDDYFVDRDNTPKDENGKFDFESIDAIDRVRFNEDLKNLIDGKAVKIPRFNFEKGMREERNESLKITKNQPIIIEGIHGLNPTLTEYIDDTYKFKIYVSCLTQLNIDNHNRIPTTDSRLIRRMVRDNNFRGNSAVKTLEQWASVRRGEEKNIFPYQESADAMFNSAAVYELSALKPHVEKLLLDVPEGIPEHVEACRLLKFLNYVKPLDSERSIPNTAIVREFIGGNIYHE